MQILHAGRKDQANRKASPRKRGSGGKPPMSARCAKALIEGGPRRFFGSFLIAQKGTSVPHDNGEVAGHSESRPYKSQ